MNMIGVKSLRTSYASYRNEQTGSKERHFAIRSLRVGGTYHSCSKWHAGAASRTASSRKGRTYAWIARGSVCALAWRLDGNCCGAELSQPAYPHCDKRRWWRQRL